MSKFIINLWFLSEIMTSFVMKTIWIEINDLPDAW